GGGDRASEHGAPIVSGARRPDERRVHAAVARPPGVPRGRSAHGLHRRASGRIARRRSSAGDGDRRGGDVRRNPCGGGNDRRSSGAVRGRSVDNTRAMGTLTMGGRVVTGSWQDRTWRVAVAGDGSIVVHDADADADAVASVSNASGGTSHDGG